MVQQPIHIAIVGGGLGGCTLALALAKHDNITFTVYEAGSEFKEQGAAIGLSRNAANALHLMGLDWDQLCKDTGAVTVKTSQLHIANGPHDGEVAFNLGGEGDQMMFSRALLLDWILKGIPKGSLQTNKKLNRIEEQPFTNGPGERPLKLFFKDGTVATADAVIGSDGIHSKTRKIVLGETHPASEPVFAGMWECKRIMPYAEAQQYIGTEILNPENRTDHGWSGDGGYMMVLSFADNTLAAVYACGVTNDAGDPSSWSKTVPTDQIREFFTNSHPNCQGIIDCLLAEPEILTYTYWESAEAPSFCKDRICIMGDAAHAPVPWISAGAGMTMEDVLILSKLIGQVKSLADLPAVFKAYDNACRPRSQTVVQYGREIGVALMGKNPEMGLNPEKLAAYVPPMFDFVRDVDLDSQVAQAMIEFHASISQTRTNNITSDNSYRIKFPLFTELRGRVRRRFGWNRHFRIPASKMVTGQA